MEFGQEPTLESFLRDAKEQSEQPPLSERMDNFLHPDVRELEQEVPIDPAYATPQDTTPNVDAILDEIRALCKEDLFFFSKFVLGYKDFVERIHGPICRLLESSYRKLKFLLPRGWFKTTLCSVAYCIWRAIKDPNVTILIVQNTYANACAKLGSIREKIEKCSLLRILFPQLIPTADCAWTSESLTIPRTSTVPEGTFEAAGVRTQVTSRHYNEIIEDDTVAPDYDEMGIESLAPVKEDIELAIGWHRLQLGPLFVNPGTGRSIVVGTRWYQNDVHSWIEENQPEYVCYTRACRETDGRPDPHGLPTFDERFGEEVLKSLEKSMGYYMYSCLYLNTPVSSERQDFHSKDFIFYDKLPLGTYEITCVVDPAGNSRTVKSKDSDANVVMTCAKNVVTGCIYVLGYWFKRATPGEVIEEIFNQYDQYGFTRLGIEGVAYQSTLEYWLEERRSASAKMYAFEVVMLSHGRRSKESRIRALQPLFRAGKLFMLQTHRELMHELEAFPLGSHDDLADSLSMHLQLLSTTRPIVTSIEGNDSAKCADAFVFGDILKQIQQRYLIDETGLGGVLADNSTKAQLERMESRMKELQLQGTSSLLEFVEQPIRTSIDDFLETDFN